MKSKLVWLATLYHIFAVTGFSAETQWPDRINGSYYKQCSRYYGADSAGVIIDIVALTYEQWYSSCGFSGTFWERGTIEKANALNKTALETAISHHEYPDNWDKIEPREAGSFVLNEDNTLIELNAEGEEYMRYIIASPASSYRHKYGMQK